MGKQSLRVKFLLTLFVLLVVVFSAVTAVLIQQTTSTLSQRLVEQSKSFAVLATGVIGQTFEQYHSSGSIVISQKVDQYMSLDPDITQIEVVSVNGNTLFSSKSSPKLVVSSGMLNSFSAGYVYDKTGDLATIVEPYLGEYDFHQYSIIYGISYSSIQQSQDRAIAFIILIGVLAMIIYLLIWYFLFSRLFLTPIANVSALSLAISQGALNNHIISKRQDEIGDLANAVNSMADSLKADIEKIAAVDKLKSEFMAITSHNLRTPISIIKDYLAELREQNLDEDIQKELGPIEANVVRLNSLAEDVLTISTLEAGQRVIKLKPEDIDALLLSIAGDFSSIVRDKQLNFNSNIATKAKANINTSYFRSAIWNLLDNSYKFTDPGGSIELTARLEDDIVIAVRDTGSGISSGELPNIFTKFHHATDFMTTNFDGAGIGLYVTKLIIQEHHGTISAESTPDKGSTFTIRLPRLQQGNPSTGSQPAIDH